MDLFSLQLSYTCSGDYCRSHGPYIVGSSSAITPRKGSLSHVGGSSSASSSLQGFLQDSGQHSLACALVFLGRQGVVVKPVIRNASAKVQSPPILLPLYRAFFKTGQHSLAFVVAFLCREGFIVNPPTRKASAKVQSP